MNGAARRPHPLAWLLRFGTAALLLNALLTFEHDPPGLGVRFGPRLSFDLCLGLIAIALLCAWRGRLGRWLISALAAGCTALVVVRYLDVTAAGVYGRPLQLYWDGRHAWEVLTLAAGSEPAWRIAAIALLTAAVLAALYLIVRRAVATLADALAWHRPRPWLLAGGAALTVSFAVHPYVHRDTRWFFALPVGPSLWHQAAMLPTAWRGTPDAALPAGPAFDGRLDALAGVDVLLLFAEAYGVTAFDDAELVAALQAPRERFAASAAAAGDGIVSARVRSPTFGGASWLAHAALLGGIDMRRPDDYERLLASDRPGLVRQFAAQGWHTVAWMPGLQRPWPEGAHWGYARVADADSMGYRGPAFGYWRIPDQASMALLQAQELGGTAAREPRFVVFPTVSSHAPFRPLAPLRDDAAALTGPDAYSPAERDAALAAPVSWLAPKAAYAASIAYTYDWLGAWLRESAPRRRVVIMIGDHQPIASVSGPDASWDVPVHVIAQDRALLDRLAARGFAPGLVPPAHTLAAMHELTPLLQEAFAPPLSAHAAP